MRGMIDKSAFNWNFREDDWLVDLVLNNQRLRQKIFKLKK